MAKQRPALHGRDHRIGGEDPIGLFVSAYVAVSGQSTLPSASGPTWPTAAVPVITDGSWAIYEPYEDDPVFDMTDPDSDEGIVVLKTGVYSVWHKIDWSNGGGTGVAYRAVSFNSRNENATLLRLGPGQGNSAMNVLPDDGETRSNFQYKATSDIVLSALGTYGNSGGGTSQGGGSDMSHLGIGYVHEKGSDATVYWEILVARLGELGFEV